jgi:hypothetical protein
MTSTELRQLLAASVADAGVPVPTEQEIANAVAPTGWQNAETSTEDDAADVAEGDTEVETETESEADAPMVRRTIRLNGKSFGPKRQAKLERTLEATSLPLIILALSKVMGERAVVMAQTPGTKRTAAKWEKAAKDLQTFVQRNSIKSCA